MSRFLRLSTKFNYFDGVNGGKSLRTIGLKCRHIDIIILRLLREITFSVADPKPE